MVTFAWELHVGDFVRELSLRNFRFGNVVWELSLGNFGSRISCLENWAPEAGKSLPGIFSLGNFHLGTFVWDISLGSDRFETIA